MEVIRKPQEMQREALGWKRQGKVVVLVPTMGALHEGHLSLLREGRRRGDVLVMSLFVNPIQFGPSEDLEAYPRDFHGDCEKARHCGVDCIFAPEEEDMYPSDFQTHVEVERLTKGLCGAHRPGHFRGVATVVAKLFNLVLPDVAIFGEKDYQQLLTIKRMVRDLDFPVKIVGMPTVREEDGLAMSSRNQYLNVREREAARCLYRGLKEAVRAARGGEREAQKIVAVAKGIIEAEPLCRLEYIELRDADSLQPIEALNNKAVLAVAAWVGKARLIDNVLITPINGPDE